VYFDEHGLIAPANEEVDHGSFHAGHVQVASQGRAGFGVELRERLAALWLLRQGFVRSR
jgi:hypothetical protein